jgi:hypothetical protein
MTNEIAVEADKLELGFEIVKEISTFQPRSSISFQSSEEILRAIEETKDLAKWGMAKNRHKMKQAAINILNLILCCEPEEPVNLNLTKYELKSIKSLRKLIKRALEKRKDGVVLK